MGMDMSAAGNRANSFADRPAIFDDRCIFGEIAHGDLVTQRNVISKFDAAHLFPFERHGAHVRAFFEIGHGNADIVLGFVQQNAMLHSFRMIANAKFIRGDEQKLFYLCLASLKEELRLYFSSTQIFFLLTVRA